MLGVLFLHTPTFRVKILDRVILTDETLIKKVGLRIKELRKARGMTQFDLAIKSDMEENALQRIEAGRTNPTLKTLLKIVNGLDDVEFYELFILQSKE